MRCAELWLLSDAKLRPVRVRCPSGPVRVRCPSGSGPTGWWWEHDWRAAATLRQLRGES